MGNYNEILPAFTNIILPETAYILGFLWAKETMNFGRCEFLNHMMIMSNSFICFDYNCTVFKPNINGMSIEVITMSHNL